MISQHYKLIKWKRVFVKSAVAQLVKKYPPLQPSTESGVSLPLTTKHSAQLNPVHSFTPRSFDIYFNIILSHYIISLTRRTKNYVAEAGYRQENDSNLNLKFTYFYSFFYFARTLLGYSAKSQYNANSTPFSDQRCYIYVNTGVSSRESLHEFGKKNTFPITSVQLVSTASHVSAIQTCAGRIIFGEVHSVSCQKSRVS
jgi:hypothetical protein